MADGDHTRLCVECGNEFHWTAGEQKFFQSLAFAPPKRCRPHRSRGRFQRPARRAAYAPLLTLNSVDEYRTRFIEEYCDRSISTFDGIDVRFEPGRFDHAFYEPPDKTRFSWARAERVAWIGSALADPFAALYLGLDRFHDCYTTRRRVCLVNNEYLAIIEFTGPANAEFVTAFPASPKTVRNVRQSPNWWDETNDILRSA